MAKYLLIGAIAISLATAVLGYMNHQTLDAKLHELEETHTKLNATTAKLTQTTKDLATRTSELEKTTSEKQDLATKLTATEGELATTKTKLDEATKKVTETEAQLADVTAERDKLKEIVDKNGTPGKSVEQVIADFNNKIATLQNDLATANDNFKASQAKVADLEEKERKRQQGIMQLGLEGRVLAVNPAWNFVVISIGDKQGVVNNAEMLLKRSGQYLGKVRVTSVEGSTSIADIVANSLPSGVAVQPGDTVIFQGN